MVFAAGEGFCRGEEFEVLSGFEEQECAVGGVSGAVVCAQRLVVVNPDRELGLGFTGTEH